MSETVEFKSYFNEVLHLLLIFYSKLDFYVINFSINVVICFFKCVSDLTFGYQKSILLSSKRNYILKLTGRAKSFFYSFFCFFWRNTKTCSGIETDIGINQFKIFDRNDIKFEKKKKKSKKKKKIEKKTYQKKIIKKKK